MTLSNLTTLTLAPADLAATYPLEGFRLSADAHLHILGETLNDAWWAALDAAPQTTSVEHRAVQAVERAVRWTDTSDGNFALTWIAGGDEVLFAMIGENLVTLEPDSGVCRLAGLPMDLAVLSRTGPNLGTGTQFIVGSWGSDISDTLVIDVVDLKELRDALR